MIDKDFSEIKELLGQLKAAPDRDSAVSRQAKQYFLAAAEEIRQSVSISVWDRLNQYHPLNYGTFKLFRKAALVTLGILLLMFGSSVLVVRASQDALPTNFLYPIKLWSEDLQIDLTMDTNEKIILHLTFAKGRLEEMSSLGNGYAEIQVEPLRANFVEHIDLAAALLPESSQIFEIEFQALETEYVNIFGLEDNLESQNAKYSESEEEGEEVDEQEEKDIQEPTPQPKMEEKNNPENDSNNDSNNSRTDNSNGKEGDKVKEEHSDKAEENEENNESSNSNNEKDE